MGLLDWIIGWFFFTQTLTWLCTIPRRAFFVLFYPNSDVAVYYSSQGRFLFSFLSYSQKWSYLSKNVISGADFSGK